MNPTPAFIAFFLLGYLLGIRVGQQVAFESLDPALSWEEIQREVAENQ